MRVVVTRMLALAYYLRTDTAVDGDNLTCSFCGKGQRQVEVLIAGPGVAICNECVDLCDEIIADTRSSGRVPSRDAARPAPGAC